MWIIVAVAAWLTTGAIAVAIMHRRGHDTFAWAWLFLFWGPLTLPLAISADRHRPPEPDAPPHEGALDVLVAHDGTPDASRALGTVLDLLGKHLTSLTLASVLDLDAPTTAGGQAEREEKDRLDTLARSLGEQGGQPVDTVVLFGETAHALQHFASQHGYELIVAGSHMAKRTRHISKDASADTSVAVLIGPAS